MRYKIVSRFRHNGTERSFSFIFITSRLSATRAELGAPESTFNELSVNVVENHAQASQVWLGGSIVASKENFHEILITRAQYEEEGARMFRQKVAIP